MKDYIKELFEKMLGKQKRYIVGPATLIAYDSATGEKLWEENNHHIGYNYKDDLEGNKQK